MAAAATGGLVPESTWNAVGKWVSGGRQSAHFGMKVRRSLRTAAAARDLEQLFTGFVDEWAGGPSPVLGAAADSTIGALDFELSDNAPDALRMMHADSVSYLPDDILCKVDRASMAVSLETHAPYLDHRVAAVAARIPLAMKIRGGTGKLILRKLLYREAPNTLFDRPKIGFAVPVGEWIKGPLRDWAEDLLDPRALQSEGWFDAQAVADRWRDHLSGKRNSTTALWAILMFQAWQREQRSGTAAAAA